MGLLGVKEWGSANISNVDMVHRILQLIVDSE